MGGEEGKRWEVTYTKQMKKKRKVYHDGFLHLHPTSNKVMLYDDTEQLLESMLVTKHYHLQSGDSIQLPSYLVDIGDLQSQHQKPTTTCSTLTPNTMRKQKHNSPSHNIIKEFKRNEALKYNNMHRSPPSTPTTPSFQEWEVLYTAQITKKSKKYHDGYLRIITPGSRQRQIVLYDLNKNQLEKRFLNKDEIIREGESMAFDSYLVDIGAPVGVAADDTNVLTDVGDKIAASSEPFGGRPHPDARSDMPVETNLHCLKVDKIGVMRRLPSHTPLRDACQILSILKKPAKQCLPQYSESVQEDGLCKDVEGSVAVPVIPPPGRTIENKDRKDADEGSGECTEVNAVNLCKIEIPVSSQQIKPEDTAVESSTKCEQVEFSQHANSNHTQTTSTVADIVTSLPLVSIKSEAYQDHQHLSTVPETVMPNEEQLAQDVPREKCSSDDASPAEATNSDKVEHSQPTLNCPSFDLGF